MLTVRALLFALCASLLAVAALYARNVHLSREAVHLSSQLNRAEAIAAALRRERDATRDTLAKRDAAQAAQSDALRAARVALRKMRDTDHAVRSLENCVVPESVRDWMRDGTGSGTRTAPTAERATDADSGPRSE